MARKYNRVTPELRRAILLRDRRCFLAGEPGHVCRDLYGTIHEPDDLDRLSLEHVKTDLAMGKRAPSDERHMVALCAYANIMVPSKAERQRMRLYLERVNAP